MKNNNGNTLYIHRIIKLISPITCQTFKIELNGKEEEMRELLGTILEINPKSIKGLRDSFNNYYTISSAVKSPLLNTDPYNYYTVVIKGNNQSNDIKYIKYPSLNLSNREQISNERINYEKNFENKTMNFLEDDNNYRQNFDKNKIKDFLKFSKELYKKNYIDKNLRKKLNKLIKENNPEVMSILESYLNSKKSYDELAKKIKPVISSSSNNSEIDEKSKNNSSNDSSHPNHKSKKGGKNHKSKKEKDGKDKSNNKKENITKEEEILNDMKLHFEKEQFSKLKDLIKKKNPEIIKSIKKFEKNKDYNHLLSKLNSISKSYMANLEGDNESDISNETSEDSDDESITKKNDSSDYIKERSKNKKKNKGETKEDSKIKNITKKIYSAMKKSRKDLYYISKFDLEKMKPDEKKTLFQKKFKLNLSKIKSENNYKLPKKNIKIIKNYYTEFMLKKVFNNFNDDEKSMYDQLCEDEDDNNAIYQSYKDLLKHKDLNELKNQIKTIIEEAEKIDVEENEEEDENKIKEENGENEEEEEEDYEGEEDEENEGDENEDDEKKEDSSSNNFILKQGDKDATAKVLNNNYKKNYQFSNFANTNNKNNENKSKSKSKSKSKDTASDKEEKKNNENNLGLDFVVVKPKKNNKLEEKKDNESNGDNNNMKLYQNQAKENSFSTNNPNKKLNAFISQIEHIKKIDEIKKPIIEAINRNNKYIMELFEKFQKNKSILNKKSLYDAYNKIKANPDSETNANGNNKKLATFKALIDEMDDLDERQKEFLCYDFAENKNSRFIGAFEGYENLKDKDEFFETVELMMKGKNEKESYVQFCAKKMKENGNVDIMANSREIIKIMKKNGLFNETDCTIMDNFLGNDDGVFLGIFRGFFESNNFNEFMETMVLALNTKKNEGNAKNVKSKWDSDLIKKNCELIKKNLDEKCYKGFDDLYKRRSEKLFNILQNLNSSNLNSKVQAVNVLILKKDLSPT